MPRPNLRDLFNNWADSELPRPARLRVAAANMLIKLRTRSNCCGNHGDPGCCIATEDCSIDFENGEHSH